MSCSPVSSTSTRYMPPRTTSIDTTLCKHHGEDNKDVDDYYYDYDYDDVDDHGHSCRRQQQGQQQGRKNKPSKFSGTVVVIGSQPNNNNDGTKTEKHTQPPLSSPQRRRQQHQHKHKHEILQRRYYYNMDEEEVMMDNNTTLDANVKYHHHQQQQQQQCHPNNSNNFSYNNNDDGESTSSRSKTRGCSNNNDDNHNYRNCHSTVTTSPQRRQQGKASSSSSSWTRKLCRRCFHSSSLARTTTACPTPTTLTVCPETTTTTTMYVLGCVILAILSIRVSLHVSFVITTTLTTPTTSFITTTTTTTLRQQQSPPPYEVRHQLQPKTKQEKELSRPRSVSLLFLSHYDSSSMSSSSFSQASINTTVDMIELGVSTTKESSFDFDPPLPRTNIVEDDDRIITVNDVDTKRRIVFLDREEKDMRLSLSPFHPRRREWTMNNGGNQGEVENLHDGPARAGAGTGLEAGAEAGATTTITGKTKTANNAAKSMPLSSSRSGKGEPQGQGQGQGQEKEKERRILWPRHEFDDHCIPMADWQSKSYPVCNDIHAVDFVDDVIRQRFAILSRTGYWRHAWIHKTTMRHENDHGVAATDTATKQAPSSDNNGHHGNDSNFTSKHKGHATTLVWKTHKFEHEIEEQSMENSRVDGLAMERLTSSTNVVNLYAYCAMTVVTEYAHRKLSTVVRRTRQYRSKSSSSTSTSSSTKTKTLMKVKKPLSSSSSLFRLGLATQVARAVADVHLIANGAVGVRGSQRGQSRHQFQPSLVHNDINPANVLITSDHRVVLNDFNVAVLLMKHNITNETCPFRSHYPNAQWRSPEEQQLVMPETNASLDRRVDLVPIVTEKVDTYGLGNILYRIAVGSSPWKDDFSPLPSNNTSVSTTHSEGSAKLVAATAEFVVARRKMINGSMPVVPSDVSTSTDVATQAMLIAMYKCYEQSPMKRPHPVDVANFLSRTFDELVRRQHEEGAK